MKVFDSKKDTWLLIIVLLAVAASLFAAVMIIVEKTAPMSYLISGFTFVVGAGFPIWLLRTTRYYVDIDSNSLIVKSAMFKWNIGIDSITSIKETRNLLSSPALSLDRLLISYGKHQHIMISPKDKHEFLAALAKD
ncbi:MAG: PH domain-containing protein [Shewanella sp.]|nr:PH domain-containing protein [Shewanella sp.]